MLPAQAPGPLHSHFACFPLLLLLHDVSFCCFLWSSVYEMGFVYTRMNYDLPMPGAPLLDWGYEAAQVLRKFPGGRQTVFL